MTGTQKKILFYSIATVVGGILAYISYVQIRLIIIYNKISTPQDTTELIDSEDTGAIQMVASSSDSDVNSIMNAADNQYQYDGASGSDNIDAAQISGILYTGDSATGIYTSSDGFIYDDNTDIVTVNGVATYADPSTVIFGTIQSDGSFIQDAV
jgi:hypothetical protein